MEGLELISFEIISTVGMARSCFIEAISKARELNFDEANSLIKEGENYFIEGHRLHTKLIQSEASGDKLVITILLTHAQDQLMSAESFKIIASEFIQTYLKYQ
ncbi:MAG: PTS lactose/cellobiose transporter subunit IIA [Erysipelothrix sp.]|nr:PTS lactose/cellobiose transporter subunit IIA [Erysipelothrix sp.]